MTQIDTSGITSSLEASKLVALILPHNDLQLIFKNLVSKIEVQQTPFLVYFKLDFYCLCQCVACKIQVQNRPKLDFFKHHLLKTIFQKSSTCLMAHNLRVSLRVGKNPQIFYLSFGCLHQFQYLSITFVVSQCNVGTCCIGCSKIIVSR